MNDRKTRTLVSLLKWFGRIKPATRLRIGACLGWLAPRLAKSRARIVRRNLELCFPDQPAAVREQWVADHFRALTQSIVDRGVLWYGTPEAIREMVTQTGAERINALTAEGRSVILLAPHFIALDAAATRLHGWRWNPLHQSGTVAFALLLVLIVTGLYLLIFYRIGAPWASVQRIDADPLLGRWIRSLHRYASDVMVLAIAAHALRMFARVTVDFPNRWASFVLAEEPAAAPASGL